jgi:hypothetical protein
MQRMHVFDHRRVIVLGPGREADVAVFADRTQLGLPDAAVIEGQHIETLFGQIGAELEVMALRHRRGRPDDHAAAAFCIRRGIETVRHQTVVAGYRDVDFFHHCIPCVIHHV